MYKKPHYRSTGLSINNSTEGQTMEQKIERIVENNEPITDRSDVIYTERKAGVLPEYNIRTDRFDLAIEAGDKITKSYIARREDFHNPKPTEGEGEGEA